MNPSTEDIVKAVEEVNAKKVIIMPNNKNIIMAADQAAEVLEHGSGCCSDEDRTSRNGCVYLHLIQLLLLKTIRQLMTEAVETGENAVK